MEISTKTTGGSLTATEFNQIPDELENIISGSGQTPSSGNLNQVGKGISNYVANGDFYTDSGIADAYVLTIIGSKQSPTEYADGFKSGFIVGNTNTGASTVNIATLGVKNIFYNGVALTAGLLTVGDTVVIKYDDGNDRFNLTGSNSLIIGSRIALGSDADGDIYYRDSGVLTRLPKGTDGQILSLASGIPAWTASTFTESFTSAEQTLTAAGSLVLAHSLSAMPTMVQARLICKTSELNYSIGDEVIVNSSTYSSASANNYGMSLNPDATNIDIRFSTIVPIFTLADKTTGTGTDITPANWKLIVRAWA